MDEVDAIEQRSRGGYAGMTKRGAMHHALRDIAFLLRAVRQAEMAARGFVDAICEGVLVPRKLPPKDKTEGNGGTPTRGTRP